MLKPAPRKKQRRVVPATTDDRGLDGCPAGYDLASSVGGTMVCVLREPQTGTWGTCKFANANYGATAETATCDVQDDQGNRATLHVTISVTNGFTFATPSATVGYGRIHANGTVFDQAGAFSFVSASLGIAVIGAVGTYSWGHSDVCNCTVVQAFSGLSIGFGTGAAGVSVGVSVTVVDPVKYVAN